MARASEHPRQGSYETLLKLAAGGMGTVFVGASRGALGFRQLVALKRPHRHLIQSAGALKDVLAEARLAALVQHANVVDVRDVQIEGEQLTLVMDYIEGASLAELLTGGAIPPPCALRIAIEAATGLHAAHELIDERGRPVGLIHRDVSPQNLLVGLDGTTRVADFGVATITKAATLSDPEAVRGKLAYMAPEHVLHEHIDRRIDVFALGIVLWESLSGRRLFRGASQEETVRNILELVPPPVSVAQPLLGTTAFDEVVAAALAKKPEDRIPTAARFAEMLEASCGTANFVLSNLQVARIVRERAGRAIESRREVIRQKFAADPSVLTFLNKAPSNTLANALRSGPPPAMPPIAEPPARALPRTPPRSPLVPILLGVIALLVVALGYAVARSSAPAVATTRPPAPPSAAAPEPSQVVLAPVLEPSGIPIEALPRSPPPPIASATAATTPKAQTAPPPTTPPPTATRPFDPFDPQRGPNDHSPGF